MKTAPLSSAMVLGQAPAAPVSAAPAVSFASALLQQVSGQAVDVTTPATGAPATPSQGTPGAPGAGLRAPIGFFSPSPAATATAAPASAATAGSGIFGYGRAGMFDTAERARMAQTITAAAPSVLLPASVTTSNVLPSNDLPLNKYRGLLAGLAKEFDVPQAFVTAVMLAESGGNANAIGDNGHSVGLFQLHDRGMGYGMGDDRFDPAKNARVGVAGLAASWHAGEAKGLAGEELVRFAYNDKFNPGGGWAYQGDRVVSYWKRLAG